MGFKMTGWSPMKNRKFQGGGNARNLQSSAFDGSDSQVNQYGEPTGGSREERIARNREIAAQKAREDTKQKDVSSSNENLREGYGRITVDDKMEGLLRGVVKGGKLDEESHNYISNMLSGKKPGVDTNIDFNLTNPRKTSYMGSSGSGYTDSPSPKGLIEKLQLYSGKIKNRDAKLAEAQRKVTTLEKVPSSKIPTKKPKLNPRKTPTEYYSKLDKEKTDSKSTTVKQKKKKVKKVSVKDKRSLSKKRAASVSKNKLQSYDKVWKENKGGLQDKFSSKEEFKAKAEEFWKGKGLGSK